MMTFQPDSVGNVHSVYLPAGTVAPPITRSTGVSNCVAAFAPVRHPVFHGTTLPKISRPRFSGRPYSTHSSAPDRLVRAVSRTESWPSGRAAKDAVICDMGTA